MNNPAKPLWVWIDPSRACNLSCRLCYSKRSHADEHLTPQALHRMLEALFTCPSIDLQKLHLNWRGDPSMNPQLVELIQQIESFHPACSWEFHTNGILVDEKLARGIVREAKTGLIFVSIDGGTETSHELNRGDGTFRPALAGLRRLIEARGSARAPRIGLYQLDLGEREETYDYEFLELADRVDEWVRTIPVHPADGRRLTRRTPSVVPASAQPRFAPTARWWVEHPQGSKVPEAPCFWAGNSLFVAPNGDVSVCLLSHSADGVIGNLLREPVGEIVASAEKFRAAIEDRTRRGVPHCSACLMGEGKAVPAQSEHASAKSATD